MATPEQACEEYERWAAEVTRLTSEIGYETCPKERETPFGPVGDSCFAEAKKELCGGDFGDRNDPMRLISLQEIEKTVAACPSCTRLVGFIRARKEARQQYGIAKRRVRSVGKRLLR